MVRLLGIHIRNFGSLVDFTVGQVEDGEGAPLPGLACFIGPNGSGKTTLLDAFGFVADCVRLGVGAACARRGGFEQLRTEGRTVPMSFELFLTDSDAARPLAYRFEVDAIDGVATVVKETLRQRRAGESWTSSAVLLELTRGAGRVCAGEGEHAQHVALARAHRLGLATLGNLADHPRLVRLCAFVEQWSRFDPDSRDLPQTATGDRRMSEGTRTLLAFDALLAPKARPSAVIVIEEPERGLYVHVIERLARDLAAMGKHPSATTQLIVTTHSPQFLDGLQPEEVWRMHKDREGRSEARRLADLPRVRALFGEGVPLGAQWYSNHFDELPTDAPPAPDRVRVR